MITLFIVMTHWLNYVRATNLGQDPTYIRFQEVIEYMSRQDFTAKKCIK